MAKIYKLTGTLDGYLPPLEYVEDKNEAEFILVGGKAFDLTEFPKLKGVFKTGVGTDNLPFEEAKTLGIKIALPVESTKDIIYEETANFTCYLILKGSYSDIGDWSGWKKNDRSMLNEHQLLLIGMGKIGSRVAAKMKGLMKIDTFDIIQNSPNELIEKLKKADCVSIHLPLTNETKNMFDESKLTLLKEGSLLVNTSRGPIVDEMALYNILKEERIRAAVDVFWEEPYRGRLTELPEDRFIRSPHVASTCREFLQHTAKDFQDFMKELAY